MFFVVIRVPCRMAIPICLKVIQGWFMELFWHQICICSLFYKVTPFQQSQVFAMHYAVIIDSWLLSLHYPWFYMWSLVLIICKMYSFIAPHKEMEEVTLLKKHWLRVFFLFNEKIITHLSEMITNIYFKNCSFPIHLCPTFGVRVLTRLEFGSTQEIN